MKKILQIEKRINENINYIETLKNKKGIKVKQDGKYYLFRYNQLDDNCNFSNKIVQECRSVILKNENGIFKRVCVPFFKFFNYGEELGKPLFEKMKKRKLYCYHKIDGAMISLWFDDGYWHISTSGNIDAHKALISNPISKFQNYGDLFDWCAKNQNLDLTRLDKNCTYIFELVGKDIRVVVPYEENKIYHTATRNNNTLRENFKYIGIEQPKSFNSEGVNVALKYRDGLTTDCEDYEGLVVRDKYYNRLKMKPDIYIKLSMLNNNGVITPTRIIDMIMNKNDDDFVAYFPNYKNIIEEYKEKRKKCSEALIEELSYLIDHKEWCNVDKRKELYELKKENVLLTHIMKSVIPISQDALKKENLKGYVENVLNSTYYDHKKSYLNLLEKF